ncbi:MAG: nucleotidyltransferase domain-containing protein [Nitrospirae bacterium]|nr:nucleotidyltransferase domain-containing protein [Nitrospirota bacterium]
MGQAIEKIFGSRTRAKALSWFFTHSDESFFVRQLATILKEDSTNLSRELAALEKAGILSSSRHGNLKYFQTNRNCSFFNELKGLILKTVGVIGEIKTVIENLPAVKFAFIYGSFAKAEEKADSDVDLIIIGDVDFDKLDSEINGLEKMSGRTINHIIYDYKEFLTKKKAKDGFIMDVLKDEKIMLLGDERELKKA